MNNVASRMSGKMFATLILFLSGVCINAFPTKTSSTFTGASVTILPATISSTSHRCSWTMKLRVGILGLPNVGKSSLFNAMARQSLAQAANFPFCTIEPTSCLVPCHDPYLDLLTAWSPPPNARRKVQATMEWVDVAGLAKNANRGEGLGNQFLGTLRDCTCLCHVVRAFEARTILVHDEQAANTPVDPVRDLNTIQSELVLADLVHVERRIDRIRNGGASSKKDDDQEHGQFLVLEKIRRGLKNGIPAGALGLSAKEERSIRSMGLLTLKPVMYAFNVDEVDFFLNHDEAKAQARQVLEDFEPAWDSSKNSSSEPYLALVCANVESQLAQSSPEERTSYLDSIGILDSTTSPNPTDDLLDDATKSLTITNRTYRPLCYDILPDLVRRLLGYSLVYTGPGVPLQRSQTTRAHLIPKAGEDSSGEDSSLFTAYDLAGRIHGDIQRGFLRAQVVSAPELLNKATDFVHAKELGILRAEGKDYALQDQEIVLIQWKGG